jgi:hypothetical protein
MRVREYEGEGFVDLDFNEGDNGLWIRPKGYGCFTDDDGYGWPILLEIWQGRLRVVVWNDIDSQAPIVIDMENARETNRKEG